MTNSIARVETSFNHGGVAIHLGQKTEHGFLVVKQTQFELELAERGVSSPPTFFLDDDMAKELLRALAKHYDSAYDTTHSREDFLHERGRVDKLINHLIGT
jgi:hypothetical protein